MSTFTFSWPSGPSEVIVTGTFDNWSQSLPLVKKSDGSFELTCPLPTSDDKIYYKYVVDGEWLVNQSSSIENDESGNANNVVTASDLVSAKETSGSAIPEANGLVAANAPAVEEDKEVKTTVMPSTEGVQQTMGEPGIVIPSNPHEIKEFSEISDVDPKSLNVKETEPETAVADNDAAAAKTEETAGTKKVKKVTKMVKKENGTSASPSTEKTPVASTTSSTTATPKKEKKKGFFSKIKKILD